jgi:thiol:disulfide interchange protein DsbD
MQRLIDRYGIWGYFIALGLAFVTGLLLSFSPCTYPMIPITVSIFAGQQRSIGKGFVLSLFYVGSMAAVYGIMGLIVASVGGVFGAWLASTPVVIGITVVFVIFALSMFGLYELQVPAWLRQRLGARASAGGVGGSIILGVVAALVVSPCVGPFVAGILLYIATSGSPLIGFAVLFVFALGLGTLYVIVGTFSSAINALPGSGMWMEAVKKFFGYVLLLMAVFFLRAIVPTTITAIATGLILIAFAVFWGGLDRLTGESKFFPRLKKFLGIVALIVATYLLLGALIQSGLILPPLQELLPSGSGQTGENEPDLIAWQSDLEQGLQQARTAGRPVLIDTWATWCANCRVLDKKTFHNVQVAAEARRFLPIKVQLEKSDSPITKDFMTRFGLKFYSLPTTLLIDSSGKVQRIMQGVVEPAEMLTEMRKVN